MSLPLVATVSDPVITNHLCTIASTCLSLCSNVLVYGKPVHYVTGLVAPHTWTGDSCGVWHTDLERTLGPNSSRVMVYPDGPVARQIARIGDSYIGCGVIGVPLLNTTVFAY